ncbi:MAG: PPC domain-containing protein [Phycisphaerales bacterium]|nr:PPC domain-containing protein [Phycisphaerales bacterium]
MRHTQHHSPASRIPIRAALLAAAITATPALAADIAETELDGVSTNNLISTAQSIDSSAFTPGADPSIFGALPTASIHGRGGFADIDFYRFNAAPGIAYFDIDGATGDTYLSLFDADGTVIGASDDSFPADPGSASDLDSFLGIFAIPHAGVFYIAVSAAGNTPNAAFTGEDPIELFRPDGIFGGHAFLGADFADSSFAASGLQEGSPYTLHITIPTPMTLSAAPAILLAFNRRRR